MKNLEKICKIGIIICFIILSVIVANTHEHWSDEAQSYLLARDNTIPELFKYIKYEGTPGLWFFIIKIFILLGGSYETFYILPIIFSTIGIVILEFKIKCPWYIKVLLPFTYFVFYQYTVVARSYCMVFPMLMIIAMIYNKRHEKPILYAIILLFFMNISLHTLVISGSLYLIFLIDTYKNKYKKNILACVLIFIELLFTLLYAIPASDCPFNGNYGTNILHVFSEATIGSNCNIIIEAIITTIILVIFIYSFKNQEKYNILNCIILFFPVTLVYLFITYQGWHIGIIWLLMLTYFIINNRINDNECIRFFILIVCLVQIYWTTSSIIYDFNNNYSASKEVATFLKENNYEEKKIYGLGYYVTGIQPYFEYNIFENRNTDKSFQLWKKNNGYMNQDELINNEADIYVISNYYFFQYYKVMNVLEERGYYKYEFNGYTYIKNNRYEPEGYIVYVK